MGAKPSDFFIGVMDFFTVLLPGAIVVGIGMQPISQLLQREAARGHLPPVVSGAQGWMVFLVGAYLTGHFLFLLGSFLDSPVYDPLREAAVPPERDRAFANATALRKELLPRTAAGSLNTFQWARAMLQLRAPAALTEVERYEADSKFFRSLAMACYALLLFVCADELAAGGGPARTRLFASAAIVAWLLLPLWLAAAHLWRGVRRKHAVAAGEEELHLWKRIPWFWRGLGAVLLAQGSLLLALRSWPGVVLLLLALLAVWRYAERRLKSTNAAYQYVIVMHSLPASAGK